MTYRLFVIIYALLISVLSYADIKTTSDYVSIKQTTLCPGETSTTYLEVTLNGSSSYSAWSFDVSIPEGIELAKYESDWDVYIDNTCIYPTERGSLSHQIQYSYEENSRILRVACLSIKSKDMSDTKGTILYIGVTADTFTKPGLYDFCFTKVCLIDNKAVSFSSPDRTAQINVGVSAKAMLSIPAGNNWSTCILPFTTDVPEGVTAYSCNSKDDEKSVLLLSPVGKISAYTPYILYSPEGFTSAVNGTVDTSAYPSSGIAVSGYLKGAITPQTAVAGDFVLANKSPEGTQFYVVSESKSIPAGKCWVSLPASSAKQSYSFAVISTGIDKNKVFPIPCCIYNMNGQRVLTTNDNQIYIHNGKKVLTR